MFGPMHQPSCDVLPCRREAEAAASEAMGLESAKKAAAARKDYKVQNVQHVLGSMWGIMLCNLGG